MNRISIETLAQTINAVRSMDTKQKERLVEEIFQKQPNLLGSVLLLPRFGVSRDKVEVALDFLLVCFQAMKVTGLTWPLITEQQLQDELERFTATIRFGEDLAPNLQAGLIQQYVDNHPERNLLAYAMEQVQEWMADDAGQTTDKYAVLAVWTLANCIASAQPRRKQR